MNKAFAIMGNKETLLIAETMAQKKGISFDEIIKALEEGLKCAARKKYGHTDIDCAIDRKTGDIKLFNKKKVISEAEEKTPNFNPKKEVNIKDAKKLVQQNKAVAEGEIEEGGYIKTMLPPIELNRIVVQIAKNEIIKKIKEAERDKEYNEFKDRVHSLINGVIKKIGLKNVVVEIDGYESLLPNNNMLPGERFRVNDRIRAYISEVRQERKGAQIFLSRTDPGFVVELFKQEVPEIYDGIIEIKGIAREPGSRVKIAVFSRDENSDVVGACIGVRGSRVQAVMSEIGGEKIDIIKWSSSLPELVVNALTPAKISKVLFDEEKETVEVIVPEDQLSLTIGRGGQNVKLASKIVGYKIDILTEEEEQKKRTQEFNEASNLFMKELDVEDVIGHLLTAEGYYSIESIIEASIDELATIEGFDKDLAAEIKKRAEEALKNNKNRQTTEIEIKSEKKETSKKRKETKGKEVKVEENNI
jgi:transcription termination/antitermination protein NusA